MALLEFGLVPSVTDTGVASHLCRWDCDWYLNIASDIAQAVRAQR